MRGFRLASKSLRRLCCQTGSDASLAYVYLDLPADVPKGGMERSSCTIKARQRCLAPLHAPKHAGLWLALLLQNTYCQEAAAQGRENSEIAD